MNEKQQLRLQAYVDGELDARAGREVEALLAADGEARALAAELRNTRSALSGFEAGIRLPESRDFYWSKIARAIERAESGQAARSPVLLAGWRRILAPALALALVAAAGLWINGRVAPRGTPTLEVAMADSDPFVYNDDASGTTLVWFSYPAENDLADLEPDDTLD